MPTEKGKLNQKYLYKEDAEMLNRFVFAVCVLVSSCALGKFISFSFDDAPRPGSFFKGSERSERLIKTLKDYSVQAAFFVNSNKVTEEGLERLKAYRDAGHLIGNHTHSHPSADKVLIDVFLADFELGHNLLEKWGFEPKLFRYPFLHRGGELEKINLIHSHIVKKGYTDAFVTLDNYDFYMDWLFQQAKTKGENINMENLKKFYVETLYKGIEYYETLAQRVYEEEESEEQGSNLVYVNHVMLLHENDLAALFLGDLIVHLKSQGWTIVSPEESYKDPHLAPFPDSVTRHGQGRIVAHATEKGFPKPLVSELEDKEVLQGLWSKYEVVVQAED